MPRRARRRIDKRDKLYWQLYTRDANGGLTNAEDLALFFELREERGRLGKPTERIPSKKKPRR